MPQKKSSTFITRPQTHAEFFQSFRKTLHGLASQGADWEDFEKLDIRAGTITAVEAVENSKKLTIYK